MFPFSVKIPEWHGSGGCILVLTVAFALLTGSLGSYPDLELELAFEAAEVRRKETPLVNSGDQLHWPCWVAVGPAVGSRLTCFCEGRGPGECGAEVLLPRVTAMAVAYGHEQA